jgi:hypothetical protein
MKIRNGFVSNSSSSSFVVRRNEWKPKGKKSVEVSILTKTQDKALEEFGFRKTTAHSPHQVLEFYDKAAWKKVDAYLKKYKIRSWNWGYEITCNQDDVMVFLIQNKIPFVASCHYGHESFVYEPKTDTLYQGINFGAIIETYGVDKYTLDRKCKPVEAFVGKDWIKKNTY